MRFIPRKQIIVDRSSQGALILRIVSYWAVSIITIGIFMLLWDLAQVPDELFFDPAYYGEVLRKYTVFGAAALLVLPLIVVDIYIQSNRFAGPIFRARRCLRELAGGQSVGRVAFRKKDHWQGLADDVNSVIEHVARLKAGSGHAGSALEAEPDAAGELATAAGENGREVS